MSWWMYYGYFINELVDVISKCFEVGINAISHKYVEIICMASLGIFSVLNVINILIL